MRARSAGEQRMWVTAGSPPAGMLRERLQGECIREQLQFFLGSLLGTFYRHQENVATRRAALVRSQLRSPSAAEVRKKCVSGGWQGGE